MKSKTGWERLGREIKPGEEAKASATLRLPHREIEYDLWHVDQTWEK